MGQTNAMDGLGIGDGESSRTQELDDAGEYLSDTLLDALWTHFMDRDMPDSLLKATFVDSATSDIRSGLLQWRAASEDTKMNDTSRDEDSVEDEENEESEGMEA